ncbi:MAG: bifunctional hydroxymethylpyrimidine kinase/phosphomethylpyrimidine kinase [Xenococcaceae cyanobacterium MO_207.B15]|nr:bifunctional hydroxymethylpyrimidine kinase/phosphomethylpyrimidine kinase [Xenococcaceae cyanobacterium MO_207.B15]
MTQVALTIAGSDSGGGAGIQADLRTFAFHRVHGTSVITCVTAQNTVEVTQVTAMENSIVGAQIATVVKDIKIDAVKTGMLFNQAIIEEVAAKIAQYNLSNLVVDPVMVTRAGVKIIDDHAIASLTKLLFPQALIVTPNRYEAQILSGIEINSLEDMKQACKLIHQNLQAKVVLIKGGSMSGKLQGVDVWYDGDNWEILTAEVVNTKNTHGTGCTLSAAIAANLALGKDLFTAVKLGKNYLTSALKYALNIGQGNGPVGHFFPILPQYSP